MKCPRCGSDMTVDSHRKIPLQMCYNCGYIEGRNINPEVKGITNFEHIKTLNFNEFVAFVSAGTGLDKDKMSAWLAEPAKFK